MRYLEVVKGGGAAADRLPMVVFVHGYGGQARDIWLQRAAAPLRTIMLQAPLQMDATSFTWFWAPIGDGQSEHLAHKLAAAGDQVARAITLLQERRPTRGRPIVAGFSQGGMLSYDMAVRYPQLIFGAVPLAGLLPRSLLPARRPAVSSLPSVHAMHGDTDNVVPLAAAREVIAYLVAQGHAATLDVYPGAKHGIPTEMAKQLESTVNALATQLVGAE